MSHLAKRLALVLAAGLMHWSCCGCDNPNAATNPTAVATPTPVPSPTATPFACTVHGLPDSFRCAAEPPPRFIDAVIAAQAQVKQQHPDVFDGSGHVISQSTYTGWVAQTLKAKGICAIGGTDDEISVKDSESSSELYDLVTGSFEAWTNYVYTCRPSLF
jgi:hypothetical protein